MRRMITWMVIGSLMTAQPAVFADHQPAVAPQLVNVEFNKSGALVGRIVDAKGAPVVGKKVILRDQKKLDETAGTVVTDSAGEFHLVGLQSGRVLFDVDNETYGCRTWNNGAAPPKSLTSVSVVAPSTIVRGQDNRRRGPLGRLASLSTQQKLCLGLLVAAAIVIPIALDDDDAS